MTGDVGSWWCQVAVFERLMNNVEGATPAWLFEIGGHASNSVDFKVGMTAAAELFGSFERGGCMFGKIAQDSQGMVLGGGKEVWFPQGVLSSA